MRQRRLLRFHGLKRGRVRQTWNKYNLFNISRLKTPNPLYKTFFQQKWVAKSMTRAYHGEHIKEHQWERMFNRRMLSAVNLDPYYMARHDGSEQAAGRGSGRALPPGVVGSRAARNTANYSAPTPYMQMVFAPMERRLDVAIFRALFASSARQARQMVLHGGVTVNGKRMRHPSYLLNPGDMFQVDMERVLTATGKPRRGGLAQKGRSGSKAAAEEEPAESEEAEGEAAEGAAAEGAEEAADPAEVQAEREKHIKALRQLGRRARDFIGATNEQIRARQKQRIRKLLAEIKATASRAPKTSATELKSAQETLSSLFDRLTLDVESRDKDKNKNSKDQATLTADLNNNNNNNDLKSKRVLTARQFQVIKSIYRLELKQPANDPTKPYVTPWRPRDWMAPFAFIPRYLEVNQHICAAVYLRHPVARPSLSEVPTPFPQAVSQLAFNWYLRRG